MVVFLREFSEQREYYCSRIESFLDGYKAAVTSEDGGGVLGQAGFVSSLAEVTLGYIDNIVSEGLDQTPIDELLPRHKQLSQCFRETSDALLKGEAGYAGARYKSVIDRAHNALLKLNVPMR